LMTPARKWRVNNPSGGWDNKLKCWDARLPAERRCVATVDLPGKVYSMSMGRVVTPGGVRLVTWTAPAVINWCLRSYSLLRLPPLPGVTPLVTWAMPAVIN
jgi:hypothetical protein